MAKVDIIFEEISSSSYYLLKILSFLNLNIYYLNLVSRDKKKLFNKLSKIKVTPLALDDQKSLHYDTFCEGSFDKNENMFKKNELLFSQKIVQKFCKFFLIDNFKEIDLRLALQDKLFSQTSQISTKIKLWSEAHKDKKLILISFNFQTFYFIDEIKNLKKIIIPINFLNLKILHSFKNILKRKKKIKIIHNKTNNPFLKKVAFIIHKGTTTIDKLYDKELYYSDKDNSPFNKKNIVHLDYEDYSKPNDDYLWLNLKKLNFPKKKIALKILIIFFKTLSCITSWKNFLAWVYLIRQYVSYVIYLEKLAKFQQLKIAIIDYDHLCPKGLIFALKKKKIKIVSTQERFVGGLFRSFYNVIADTYFTCSDYMNEKIKNSKYFQVNNPISVGQYRVDYLEKYYENNVPEEITIQKNKGKKIIVALGLSLSDCPDFDPKFDIAVNWNAQKNFIDDMLKLTKDIKNSYLIFRFRSFVWKNIPFFQSSLKKINENPNVSIASDYSQFFISYKYCANADLIIAKRTSLADECLAFGKKLIFYDYTHNLKKIISDLPEYIPERSEASNNFDIFCHNYNEIFEKSDFLLNKNSSELENYRKKIDQLYSLKDKKKVREKILSYLELQL